MISRRAAAFGLASIAALGLATSGASPGWSNSAWARSGTGTLDSDNDGTVDLAEAKKAASALFDRLDRDKDGTLDRRELRGRLDDKELAAADRDMDGKLSKDEYFAVVEQRFKAANPGNDGTLDAKELATQPGRSLLRLLK